MAREHIMVALSITGILLLLFISKAEAKTEHQYNLETCQGAVEYTLEDKTRVDCITETHVIEVDFSKKSGKIYECIGQALHYGFMTSLQPWCRLINETAADCRYYYRAQNIGMSVVPRIVIDQIGPHRCD